MNISTFKRVGCAIAIATTLSFSANAQDRIKEGIWETEYKNMVENGLTAIKSKNYDKAFEKLTSAADMGSKEAQFYLAQMYLNGWGMGPDYKLGWLWLNVALEHSTPDWPDEGRALQPPLPTDFPNAR